MDGLSIILSLSVLAVIIGGLWNRITTNKGIGWQFIRFTVIAITIPMTAILALNNVLTGEITNLLGLHWAMHSENQERMSNAQKNQRERNTPR